MITENIDSSVWEEYAVLVSLGHYVTVGFPNDWGTYATIELVVDAYANGGIGKSF
jgi:hypothetical protein